MELQHILTLDRTHSHAACSTKKSMLELISKILAGQSTILNYSDILTKLVERERLGSTGIGHGVAIPHARISALHAPIASLIRLDTPIDFDSTDDQPVDLFFGFIVPEGLDADHLDLISTLATLFNEENFRSHLREADSDESLFNAMIGLKKEALHD